MKINKPIQETVEKPLVILLADIRGFSQLVSSVDSAIIVEMLNAFYSEMANLVEGYGGRVDKFMGDSVLAVFGLDEDFDDAIVHTLTCSVLMQKRLIALNAVFSERGWPKLFMGVAVNAGNVIAAQLGNRHYREFTVIGDVVNIAARIEAHSLRGQILITDQVIEHAKDVITFSEPMDIYIKGQANPITIYELQSILSPEMLVVPRIEARKSPRVQVHLPLAFRRIAGAKVLDEEYQGEIIDIGYQGMKAELPVYLDRFTEIKFPFTERLFDSTSSDVYAKVINTQSEKQSHYSSMEFTSMSPSSQRALHEFVDNLIQ